MRTAFVLGLAVLAPIISVAQVTTEGPVSVYRSEGNGGGVDFEHAKPMPLPANPLPPPSREELLRQGRGVTFPGPPRVSPGGDGPQ